MRTKRAYLPIFALLIAAVFTAGVALLFSSGATAAGPEGAPVVNGLFYGDGDDASYIYLSENPDRAKLYYYLNGDTLYVAVVLDRAVNDNVFGDTSDDTDKLYLQSAGWAGVGNQHNFKALELSENMEFRLTCAAIDESWIQGYLYDLDGDTDPNEADWLSGPGDNSNGGPPPSTFTLINTASSLQWNLNNFASGGSPSWDITLVTQGDPPRTTTDDYKSPGDGADDADVTDEIGYPPTGPITFDTANGWEWPIVYEFSVDTSACAGAPLGLQVISAHNSPPKDGDPDIPIDFYDLGDLPDSYGTTLPVTGANHLIQLNGPILGTLIDGEQDGQPTVDATGDDAGGSDDEDGLTFDLINTDWTAGNGELDATVTGGDACLDVWVDFADDAGLVVDNGDGDFFDAADGISEHVIANEQVSSSDPQPLNFIFPLPVGINEDTSVAVRARLSPRDSKGGCFGLAFSDGGPSPIGPAIGGEVEDYLVAIVAGPTPTPTATNTPTNTPTPTSTPTNTPQPTPTSTPEPTNTELSSFGGDNSSGTGWWMAAVALLVVLGVALAMRRRPAQ